MKFINKLGLVILFGLLIWLTIFAPIDTATTIELLITCYGISILLAFAFIYIDKKKDHPHGVKKIFFYSILYGTICFFLFWLI